MDNYVLIAIFIAIIIVIVIGITILMKTIKDDAWIKTNAVVHSVMQTHDSSFGVEHANISFQRGGNTVYSRIGGLSTGRHSLQAGLVINIRYKANRHFGSEFYKCFLEEDADRLVRSGRKASIFAGVVMVLIGIASIVVLIFFGRYKVFS